jgi:hypothetical protein
MRINSIFEKVREKLFAVSFEVADGDIPVEESLPEELKEEERNRVDGQKDELINAFERWKDVRWLRWFFNKYRKDLTKYDSTISVKAAIYETFDCANDLYDELIELAGNGDELGKLFRPLHNEEDDKPAYERQKLKGKKSWLRLYAIKYEDFYVITGSAIKLTRTMQERPHTKRELVKLDLVKRYLDDESNKGSFVYLDIN